MAWYKCNITHDVRQEDGSLKIAVTEPYAFILQHGLLEDFRHFINSLPDGTDPHGLCVDILIKQASTWKD